MRVPCGEQHRDRVRVGAAGREQQGLGGRGVEPVGVVHDDQDGRTEGERVEQGEQRLSDRDVPVGARGPPAVRAQRAPEHPGVVRIEVADGVEHAPQQQMQTGERQFGLGFEARAAQDGEPGGGGRGGGVVQQGRLTDARLPLQDEGVSASGAGIGDETVQSGQLLRTAEQGAGGSHDPSIELRVLSKSRVVHLRGLWSVRPRPVALRPSTGARHGHGGARRPTRRVGPASVWPPRSRRRLPRVCRPRRTRSGSCESSRCCAS